MSELQAPAGLQPSASYSVTMRIELPQHPGSFARVAGAIGEQGAILGDIGPEAAMPVMEGKAMLFRELAGVDAFPLCLATKDVDEIVAIVKAVAPTFGGINLEDISAPRCFTIERRLRDEIDIPVFHDD